jgi:hypothetical protein
VIISPTNAWAVGDYSYTYPNQEVGTLTLIEHWDGSQWNIVPSPNDSENGISIVNFLGAIAASGPDNVWSVGEAYGQHHDFGVERSTLTMEYSGGCAPTATPTSTVTPTVPTDTPTPTYTDTNTPTNTDTPTPTYTNTPASFTATPTNTPTYTPTPTFTEIPTATPTSNRPPCGLWITMTTSCSTALTYDYSMTFNVEELNAASFTVYLEVASDPGGPWIEIDHQDVTLYPIPETYSGTFTETNVPFRYSWYHIWTFIPYICPPNYYSAYAETLPNYVCFLSPSTPTPTNTPVATNISTSTPTPTCTLSFEDVPPDSTFYPYIQCLACRDIINGYPCGGPGEPCNGNNDPYFRPGNNVTRGQFAKIASNSAGFNDIPIGQQYEDILPGSTFYTYTWSLSDRGYINGYPCGDAGEPCVPPTNLPYFRPNANVTRGQLSKIASNAAGLTQTPDAQQYEDVVPGSTFYEFIWRLTDLGVMNGYPCGGVGEPCVPPTNLPYFRPGANATRGQASKIVSNTFFPECQP